MLKLIFLKDNMKQSYIALRKHIHPKNCYKWKKNNCYPNNDSYTVTETTAEVKLQHLLDIAVSQLLRCLKDVVEALNNKESCALFLICKKGCHGSQNREYKQKFKNDVDSHINIFQSSFVPFQLIVQLNKRIILHNPTPYHLDSVYSKELGL